MTFWEEVGDGGGWMRRIWNEAETKIEDDLPSVRFWAVLDDGTAPAVLVRLVADLNGAHFVVELRQHVGLALNQVFLQHRVERTA